MSSGGCCYYCRKIRQAVFTVDWLKLRLLPHSFHRPASPPPPPSRPTSGHAYAYTYTYHLVTVAGAVHSNIFTGDCATIGCSLPSDSMRRRSSGSSEEDDDINIDQDRLTESALSEDDGRKRSFTSAKFDITRQSVTLDRRKVEKNNPSPPATYNASNPQTQHLESTEKHNLSETTPRHSPDRMGQLHTQWRSRVRNQWRCSLLTLTTTALSFVLLLAIVHSFLTRQVDPKGCNNCLMRPAYAKLSEFDTEHTRFASKYSLYLYREGGIDEDTMVRHAPLRLCKPG